MRNSSRGAIALVCGLICLVLAWQSVAISPVAAQEETITPTPTMTPAPTPTPGSSSEEVFRLDSGSTFVLQHSVSWGEITIIVVLLVLIYIIRFSNDKTRKD